MEKNSIFTRTIAVVMLWCFLPAPLCVYDRAGFSNAAFALRPGAFAEKNEAGWQKISEANLPKDIYRDLRAYGLQLGHVECTLIRPPDGGGIPRQPFEHNGAEIAVSAAVNQALGSILFKGRGKRYKVTADGNAVFMGLHALVDYSLRHPNEAFLILGNEGERDYSISLNVGSIIYQGKIIRFKDMKYLRGQIRKLLRKNVYIRGVIGDALEVTNAFVEGGPDTWSVMAIIDLPQDLKELKQLALIPDKLRRAGWVYNAPRPANNLTPFTLPNEAFREIAKANGVDPDNQEEVERWMAMQRQCTLHGNRPFLGPHRDQGLEMANTYPGFQTHFPNDGDLVPATFAAMGLKIDGHYVVVCTRHGNNEAMVVETAANNIAGAHFVHTNVSKERTEKAHSLTKEIAHDFTVEDRALAAGLGVKNIEAIDTGKTWPHKGAIAMASVTGASRQLAGQFEEVLKEVEFRKDPRGLGGEVVVHTFLLAQDGSAYAVRTTLSTNNLPETQEWLKLASRLPSRVPPSLEKPQAQARLLEDLRGVLDEANQEAVDRDPNREISQTFRYVLPEHLAGIMQKLGIGYHLTFLQPGVIGSGTNAEYNGTAGHFHSQDVGELIEIYDGQGEILLWRVASDEPANAAAGIRIPVKEGDKFFVPHGWAHKTLNTSPDRMLVFGTWLRNDIELVYKPVSDQHGAPWYIGPGGTRTNSKYTHVPNLLLQDIDPDYLGRFEVPTDRSIWSLAITDPQRFSDIMQRLKKEQDSTLTEGPLLVGTIIPTEGEIIGPDCNGLKSGAVPLSHI